MHGIYSCMASTHAWVILMHGIYSCMGSTHAWDLLAQTILQHFCCESTFKVKRDFYRLAVSLGCTEPCAGKPLRDIQSPLQTAEATLELRLNAVMHRVCRRRAVGPVSWRVAFVRNVPAQRKTTTAAHDYLHSGYLPISDANPLPVLFQMEPNWFIFECTVGEHSAIDHDWRQSMRHVL